MADAVAAAYTTAHVESGIVGWRGMVGSVSVQRMREERDFDHFEPLFFSTRAGGTGPVDGRTRQPVKDAKELAALRRSGDHFMPGRASTRNEMQSAAGAGPAGKAIGSTPRARCA